MIYLKKKNHFGGAAVSAKACHREGQQLTLRSKCGLNSGLDFFFSLIMRFSSAVKKKKRKENQHSASVWTPETCDAFLSSARQHTSDIESK